MAYSAKFWPVFDQFSAHQTFQKMHSLSDPVHLELISTRMKKLLSTTYSIELAVIVPYVSKQFPNELGQ